MAETLRSAVAVVLPQDVAGDSLDGCLEEFVAAEVPIVATEHALMAAGLAPDAVQLVPQQDPGALADAVLRIIIDPHLGESIARRAAGLLPAAIRAGMAGRFGRVIDAAVRSSRRSPHAG
jgi:hypothetical protein